jgi:Tol biopolymer transport system component
MAAWSPVGEEIAVEEALTEDRHALWIVHTDRSSARRLVEYPMTTYGGLDWTPDGKTLVYSALADGRMQLFSIPAAGGESRQLTKDSANLLHPQVSPDGRFIAATRLIHRKEIWRVRLPQ